MARGGEIIVKLEGEGVTPSTVDALSLLELAQNYFRLLVKLSEAQGHGLAFRGLRVLKRSVGIASTPSAPNVARSASKRATRVVSGQDTAPRGTEGLVKTVRRCVEATPPTQAVVIRMADWQQRIRVPRIELVDGPWESTTLRVRPIRVGGKEPTATFASDSEPAEFTLAVKSKDHARALGSSLYLEVDVEAAICRNHDGLIERGRVLAIHRLADEPDEEAWRTWYCENAGEWDDVGDIEAELQRGVD